MSAAGEKVAKLSMIEYALTAQCVALREKNNALLTQRDALEAREKVLIELLNSAEALLSDTKEFVCDERGAMAASNLAARIRALLAKGAP